MWLCLNNAFLSIVANPKDSSSLIVRARRQGDIEDVFGETTDVVTLDGRDYQFRAIIPRGVVSDVIASVAFNINYGNFKDSVLDPNLHDAYFKIWHVMAEQQPRIPYRSHERKGFDKHPVRASMLNDILGDNLSQRDAKNDD